MDGDWDEVCLLAADVIGPVPSRASYAPTPLGRPESLDLNLALTIRARWLASHCPRPVSPPMAPKPPSPQSSSTRTKTYYGLATDP